MTRIKLCVVLTFVIVGCSRQPSTPTQPTPASNLFVSAIAFEPRAMNGGTPTRGTLTLNLPASSPTTISLVSDRPSAVVPGSVTVPAGLTTATFPIATSAVSEDTTASITATVAGRTTQAAMYLWQIVPNSFWYDSEAGDWVGAGRAEHISAPGAVRASCDRSTLYVQVSRPGSFWSGQFSMPSGTPLRPGAYEFTSGFDQSRPRMTLGGDGRACQTNGRFTIEAADLNVSGAVEHFVVTFEQRCNDNTSAMRGEFRFANPPGAPGGASPEVCLR